MKFKVGDKVKGISNKYGITNTDMYLGEVKKVGDHYIEILILKHLYLHQANYKYSIKLYQMR